MIETTEHTQYKDEEAFRQGVRDWIAEHHKTLEAFVPAGHGPAADVERLGVLLQALYDDAWMAWGWPPEAGGTGGSLLYRVILGEEIVAAGLANVNAYSMLEVLSPSLANFGSAELIGDVLPKILSGRELLCQGFSEPGAGSDLGNLQCRARRDGDHYVVNGQKIWTSYAQWAARCILLVRTGPSDSGHKGVSALLVDMDTPGVTTRPLRTMGGVDEFAELFFDDVVVPASRLLGPENQGWAVTLDVLARERGMTFWARSAFLVRCLAELAEIAGSGTRRPASLVTAYEAVYAVRARSRLTARGWAAGLPVGPLTSVDKLLMTVAEQRLLDCARELLPGVFESADDPFARRWREEWFFSRAASIYGGTSEMQRNVIAKHVLGLPKERHGS